MSDPILVGTDSDCNLVEFRGKLWRIPRSLGRVDLANLEHRALTSDAKSKGSFSLVISFALWVENRTASDQPIPSDAVSARQSHGCRHSSLTACGPRRS
jgi:hypothetical protein